MAVALLLVCRLQPDRRERAHQTAAITSGTCTKRKCTAGHVVELESDLVLEQLLEHVCFDGYMQRT